MAHPPGKAQVPAHQRGRGARVADGGVRVVDRLSRVPAGPRQAMRYRGRQPHMAPDVHRAQVRQRNVVAGPTQLGAHEAMIEARVVSHQDGAVEALQQTRRDVGERGCPGDHAVVDPVHPLGAHRALRVDQGMPLVEHLTVRVAAHHRQLDDPVDGEVHAGRLDVDDTADRAVERDGRGRTVAALHVETRGGGRCRSWLHGDRVVMSRPRLTHPCK